MINRQQRLIEKQRLIIKHLYSSIYQSNINQTSTPLHNKSTYFPKNYLETQPSSLPQFWVNKELPTKSTINNIVVQNSNNPNLLSNPSDVQLNNLTNQLTKPSAVHLNNHSAVHLNNPSAVHPNNPSNQLTNPSAVQLDNPSNQLTNPSTVHLNNPSAVHLKNPSAVHPNNPSNHLTNPSAVHLNNPSNQLPNPSGVHLKNSSAVHLNNPSPVHLNNPSNQLTNPSVVHLNNPANVHLNNPANQLPNPSAVIPTTKFKLKPSNQVVTYQNKQLSNHLLLEKVNNALELSSKGSINQPSTKHLDDLSIKQLNYLQSAQPIDLLPSKPTQIPKDNLDEHIDRDEYVTDNDDDNNDDNEENEDDDDDYSDDMSGSSYYTLSESEESGSWQDYNNNSALRTGSNIFVFVFFVLSPPYLSICYWIILQIIKLISNYTLPFSCVFAFEF